MDVDDGNADPGTNDNTDTTESNGPIEISPYHTLIHGEGEGEESTSFQQEQLNTPTSQDEDMVDIDTVEEQELVVCEINNETPTKKKDEEEAINKIKRYEKKMKDEEKAIKKEAKEMRKMTRKEEKKKRKEQKKKDKEQNKSETEKRVSQTIELMKIFYEGAIGGDALKVAARTEVAEEDSLLLGLINTFIADGQNQKKATESALAQLEELRNIKWSHRISENESEWESEGEPVETVSDAEFIEKGGEPEIEEEYQQYGGEEEDDDDDDEYDEGKFREPKFHNIRCS